MEQLQDSTLYLDSPSKQSYIGSFYMPPERIPHLYVPHQDKTTANLTKMNTPTCEAVPDSGSGAVMAALKTLQEKIRRLELERLQAERNVERFTQPSLQFASSAAQPPCIRNTGGDSTQKKELVSQLNSAEARCSMLEKQLHYMRKMVESSQKKGSAAAQRMENKKAHTDPQIQDQLQKLENLEKECVKLTNTQSEAERKIRVLEFKLLEEEHERKLVQEKAEELQRELEANMLALSGVETKPKKKCKEKIFKKKAVKAEVPAPRYFPKAKPIPFVAGTSTSPSHSVNANVQSVLHLMKTRQPRLCERVQTVQASENPSHRASRRMSESTNDGAAALGSLSELLLALQDELGQMSFEHQELVRQIDETDKRELRDDLERELDCLVRRMEEKAAQITKLRKHQQTVQKLSQSSPKLKPRRAASADGRRANGAEGGVRVLPSSTVKDSPARAQRQHVAGQERLKLLRDAKRLQFSLRRQDVSWET